MGIINKLANKIGLRKRRYYTLMVRREDYISFKSLAAHEKENYVNFFHELLGIYIDCKQKNHEATIGELLRKQDALVHTLRLYKSRVGELYFSPAEKANKQT